METKGFVTLAVGDISYFVLAKNLLDSYRYHAKNPLPFAIVADKVNEYTQCFDVVILLPDATRSYMDKIELLNHLPFDRNVFIDADCLVYRDCSHLIENTEAGGGKFVWLGIPNE